jgi:hypothetical protein
VRITRFRKFAAYAAVLALVAFGVALNLRSPNAHASAPTITKMSPDPMLVIDSTGGGTAGPGQEAEAGFKATDGVTMTGNYIVSASLLSSSSMGGTPTCGVRLCAASDMPDTVYFRVYLACDPGVVTSTSSTATVRVRVMNGARAESTYDIDFATDVE